MQGAHSRHQRYRIAAPPPFAEAPPKRGDGSIDGKGCGQADHPALFARAPDASKSWLLRPLIYGLLTLTDYCWSAGRLADSIWLKLMVGHASSLSPKPRSAHVIVLGNEKGGSGKSTLAVHLIIALLKEGYRVASIDTDSRQLSLTRYIENRARFARKAGIELQAPTHYSVCLGEGKVVAEVEAREFAAFAEIIERLGERFDFVVVDTPANDSYRMRLSHAMADTLVTPINDSFVDLDVLGQIEGETLSVRAVSQYAELVQAARRDRAVAGMRETNWVVARNRIATIANRNQRNVIAGMQKLSGMLGFRIADGISERLIFRELFPTGLTVFDTLERRVLGTEPTMSHVAARREIRELLEHLRLPKPPVRPVLGGGPVLAAVAAAAQ
jgi:chromosome partitioning protein